MAITVFKQDKEKFSEYQLRNLYEDMIDSIIERMQQDYFKIKTELLTKHHVDIKRIEKGKYEINKEIMEFSPEELKKFTENVMSDYLYGDNAAEFERKDRIWND
ncbi:hypothetical protein [Paucisalibacillus globulus]|uniref:hypothetical protein n=1 Tax=Paucisalibacillus globulus TaxID=351095 RepID=UPI000BB6B8DF|nr:hypothetical protein [Paucisalibacillus globulus]